MPRTSTQSILAAAALAVTAALAAVVLAGGPKSSDSPAAPLIAPVSRPVDVRYHSVKVHDLDIFYREAGDPEAPTILLLHGFPTSSHMFRNLIPALADSFHVIAPDYPGFGYSSAPSVDSFEYTFDHLAQVVDDFTDALGLDRFAIYVQDYGAPIGFRIASKRPERITGLIIQNGNAYEEGLGDFWIPFRAFWREQTDSTRAALAPFFELDATKWQWTHGVRDPSRLDPDTWTLAQAGLDRPGNKDIQLALFLSYGSNPPLYPRWQQYFRDHQPPTLVVWGANDFIFPASGAEPYKRDLRNIDFNLLDTGHFALEDMGDEIARKIRTFMNTRGATRSRQ